MNQSWLPLNPRACPAVVASGLHAAWSFTCNADWQSYAGETTMSNFSQVFAIMVHQFISGATGLAVLVAVGRALKRASVKTVGNFWADVTRGLIYFVIPLSVLWAIPLAWQGVPQTWKAYPNASLMEPYTTQVQATDAKGNNVTTNIAVPCLQAQAGRQGPADADQRPAGDGGYAADGRQGRAHHDQRAGHGERQRGHAGHPRRPGGRARIHQATLHQRRRLVQREQRASV
jgi:hypothetical protein